MKNFKIPILNQTTPEIQLSIDQSFEAMEPYLDILESDDGIKAKIMVSSVVSANLIGLANAEDLEVAIQEAYLMTGIPTEKFIPYVNSLIVIKKTFIKGEEYD